MKSYVNAINSNELESYRFQISSLENPQYGAGVMYVKHDKNYRAKVYVLRSTDSDGLNLNSKNITVVENTGDIPSSLYSVISNLLGLMEKYSLGLITNPKDLEALSSIGKINVFIKTL